MPSDALKPSPRYRRHEWLNVNTLQVVYSIQARVGTAGWMNVSQGGKILLFVTAEQRDAAMEAMGEAPE